MLLQIVPSKQLYSGCLLSNVHKLYLLHDELLPCFRHIGNGISIHVPMSYILISREGKWESGPEAPLPSSHRIHILGSLNVMDGAHTLCYCRESANEICFYSTHQDPRTDRGRKHGSCGRCSPVTPGRDSNLPPIFDALLSMQDTLSPLKTRRLWSSAASLGTAKEENVGIPFTRWK